MKLTALILGLLAIQSTTFANPKDQKYLALGKIAEVKIAPGASTQVVVPVTIGKEYHIQANPASEPQLIPTTLDFEATPGLKPGKAQYPAGKPYRLQTSANEILVYSGKFEMKVPLTAEAGAPVGKQKLTGKLRFQACNDKICFFPTTIPVEVPVRIVAK